MTCLTSTQNISGSRCSSRSNKLWYRPGQISQICFFWFCFFYSLFSCFCKQNGQTFYFDRRALACINITGKRLGKETKKAEIITHCSSWIMFTRLNRCHSVCRRSNDLSVICFPTSQYVSRYRALTDNPPIHSFFIYRRTSNF